MGDGRGYNLRAPYSDYIYPFTDLNESGLTSPLVQAWESLYIVVQQANKVINGIKGGSMSESVKPQYIAEARFMRGVAWNMQRSIYLKHLMPPVVSTNTAHLQCSLAYILLTPDIVTIRTVVPVIPNIWNWLRKLL